MEQGVLVCRWYRVYEVADSAGEWLGNSEIAIKGFNFTGL